MVNSVFLKTSDLNCTSVGEMNYAFYKNFKKSFLFY